MNEATTTLTRAESVRLILKAAYVEKACPDNWRRYKHDLLNATSNALTTAIALYFT